MKMYNWKRYIPDGTKDILFEECENRTEIISVLRKIYSESGYSEIISPTLEFYDVFNTKNSTIEQEKMYKLFDNQGRILVLRPDITTPIARIAATKLKDAPHPLRLFYTSNVFRINENLNGKLSEITQSGAEIIGVNNLRADVEVIMTGIKTLLGIGLKNFKIELGHAEFYKAILDDIGIESEEEELIRTYIQDKNYTLLDEYLEKNKKRINNNFIKILKELPKLFGGADVIEKALSMVCKGKGEKALLDLKAVYNTIVSMGFGGHISIDLGMVQHLNYYTGIIFRGYAEGVGGNVLSGGRYDSLIEQFGESQPATGFALNIDTIITALKYSGCIGEKSREKILIYFDEEKLEEAYERAEELREKGSLVELCLLSSEKDAKDYAEKKNMKLMYI